MKAGGAYSLNKVKKVGNIKGFFGRKKKDGTPEDNTNPEATDIQELINDDEKENKEDNGKEQENNEDNEPEVEM